jgi:lysyl-tRNA synthetase class 1
MQQRKKVAEILNRSRREPWPENWYPITVYCEKCNKDDAEITDYDEDYTITYTCKCGFKNTINFSKVGIVKPYWRPDWAARWVYYDEAFESAGKDHMVKGSSFDSASAIVKEVFKEKPPYGIMYDFVRVKGMGGKMSASKGGIITVTDTLEIYLPEMVRFFFAGTKPNKEFSIPFDEEAIKMYEDFFKAERIYYGKEKVSARDKAHWSRVYEMSAVDKPPKTMPIQPSFRHCIELINIHKDPKRALKAIKTSNTRYQQMLESAKNWLEYYAPEKYKFTIQTTIPKDLKLSTEQKHVLKELAKDLKARDWTESELFNIFGELCKAHKLEYKDLFKAAYGVLLNKEKGPRLAPFILAIGKDKVAKLFEQV